MNALRGISSLLLAVSFVVMTGCDEDDGGGAGAAGAGGSVSGLSGSGGTGAGTGGTGGTGGSLGAAGTGNTCAPLPPKTGTVTGSFKDFDGNAHEVSLPEIGCRMLQRRDGTVVGYQASFGTFTPGTSIDGQYMQLPAVRLRIGAAFHGDGTYDDERVYVRAADGANTSTPVSVVVSESGKRGKITVKSDASVLEYTCDAGDRTDAGSAQALAEGPGRVVIEDATGIAVAFDNLTCNSFGTLTLRASGPSYCTPSEYLLTPKIGTDTTSPGDYALDGGSYAYLDGIQLGRVNTGPGATLTVAAGEPRHGSFDVPASGGTHVPMKGTFTCPSPP